MDSTKQRFAIPEDIKGMLTLVMSIVTAVLYAVVLGGAMVRTVTSQDPSFSDNAVRAAGLLSGLIGSVVTAGFARSQRSAPSAGDQGLGGVGVAEVMARSAQPSRMRRKLAGLAGVIGFPAVWTAPRRSVELDDEPGPESPGAAKVTVVVALLYFAVYSLVGLSAFLLSAFRADVPDIIGNSAWVWLGTVLTSSYSFFGLDNG